jgi:hypothetical protein
MEGMMSQRIDVHKFRLRLMKLSRVRLRRETCEFGVPHLRLAGASSTWIWTASKEFSAISAYLASFEGRTLWVWHVPIWKCKAPLKFKLFRGKWRGTVAGWENEGFAMALLAMILAPSA